MQGQAGTRRSANARAASAQSAPPPVLPEPPAHSEHLLPSHLSRQRTVSGFPPQQPAHSQRLRPPEPRSAQSAPHPAPSPRGWIAHPTGAHVCDRQTEGPKGVHSAGSVPVPLAEGVRCLWGSGLGATPSCATDLKPSRLPLLPAAAGQEPHASDAHGKSACDSRSGLSKQACDSEGGRAELSLHTATTPARSASGAQGRDPGAPQSGAHRSLRQAGGRPAPRAASHKGDSGQLANSRIPGLWKRSSRSGSLGPRPPARSPGPRARERRRGPVTQREAAGRGPLPHPGPEAAAPRSQGSEGGRRVCADSCL